MHIETLKTIIYPQPTAANTTFSPFYCKNIKIPGIPHTNIWMSTKQDKSKTRLKTAVNKWFASPNFIDITRQVYNLSCWEVAWHSG